ncbi:MAG TPA: hypothetical protein VFN23_09120, partial [Ktedonobacteraceae bacterium]|nr:hypothetical protein [Ktedonobacteraceae bacterium]
WLDPTEPIQTIAPLQSDRTNHWQNASNRINANKMRNYCQDVQSMLPLQQEKSKHVLENNKLHSWPGSRRLSILARIEKQVLSKIKAEILAEFSQRLLDALDKQEL